MSKNHWLFIHPFQLRFQRGIEVYLWNLATVMAQEDVDIHVLTWAGELGVPDYAKKNTDNLHIVPAVRYYQPYFAIPFYVARLVTGNYGHVFVHFAGYGEGLALRLARLFRKLSFSIVFHFPPSLVPHRYREFEKWGFHRDAANLIAVSQSTADEVEQWAGRPCVVIEHGVDTERFSPDVILRHQIRNQLGISPDAPTLISVAALEERKGIQWGIQAIPHLLNEFPDIHYIVVGDGQFGNHLDNMVEKLGVQKNVHFLGSKADVHPYLCAADIMLVLSRGEASSISLLEALACELAAITSDRQPFNELVSDAWGIRVDEEDIQQVVLEISHLLKEQDTRIEMGKAGRIWVHEKHDWSEIAKQYKLFISRSKNIDND